MIVISPFCLFLQEIQLSVSCLYYIWAFQIYHMILSHSCIVGKVLSLLGRKYTKGLRSILPVPSTLMSGE